MLAVNVTMVLDEDTTTYLKWDFIGKVLADPGSGDSGDDDSSGGVAGDGIKNVVTVDCTCSNGKRGYTLDCEDVDTSGEECTSDPLTKCYRIKIKWPDVWNSDAYICD